MRNIKCIIAVFVWLGILACAAPVFASDAPYVHETIGRKYIIDWDAVDMHKEFTLKLAVWPVAYGTKDNEEVNAFNIPGKTKAKRIGTVAYTYNEDGIIKKYDLTDPEIFREPVYGAAAGEGSLPTNTNGWIDANGNFIDTFGANWERENLDNYRDGIALSVFDNLDKFDNVTYTSGGIMIVEFTDTLSAYNIRRYGIEKPCITLLGDLLVDCRFFTSKMTFDDLKNLSPFAEEWYTPKGELIMKNEGKWGKVWVTKLYYEIKKGTYDYKAHENQELFPDEDDFSGDSAYEPGTAVNGSEWINKNIGFVCNVTRTFFEVLVK